jgi:heat-inducible transcriptional repressor
VGNGLTESDFRLLSSALEALAAMPSSLDSRKIRILHFIVNDYVSTFNPVGSERLLKMCDLGCKSATVRNEMADLSDLGYLAQPHTSAGRIPTDRGYRYYVDELMNPPAAIAPEEAERVRARAVQTNKELADIVLETCRLLSNLTTYPSLATDPSTDVTLLHRVYLTAASPRHALLVALFSTGLVEHRLVEMEAVPDDSTLIRLTNYLNLLVGDREMIEVGRQLATEVPQELVSHAATLGKVLSTLKEMVASLSERRIYLEGMNQILRQPEFQDVQRLETLLNALEQRGTLYQVLSRALQDGDTTVIIGTENVIAAMQECTVITTSYRIGNRPAGYLGVVGPTRMNYDRATAAVGLMAQSLSHTLTNLFLA